MSIPICSGGDVSAGAGSITFTNGSTTTYEITSCKDSSGNTMPGWPTTNPQIPPSGKTVQLSVVTASNKTYTYTTSPACPGGKRNNPTIHVQ
jgi:hypothetical protein